MLLHSTYRLAGLPQSRNRREEVQAPNGRDGFHSVAHFFAKEWDAVAGVLAGAFLGSRPLLLAACLALLLAGSLAAAEPGLPDIFTQEVSRFTRLLNSPVAERRIEGLQGLANLRHWPSEEAALRLLADPSPAVQREALLALGRIGTGASVPRLISLLQHPAWEPRQQAWLGLCRMSGQELGVDQASQWEKWWTSAAPTNHEQALLALAKGEQVAPRHRALRALVSLATPAGEEALIGMLPQPGLTLEERNFVAEALHRVGTRKAVGVLAGLHTDTSAWALGRIGGAEAEQALLKFPKSLPVLVNLDRLRSTNAGPFLPHLVAQMGLVTYRGQPDDLMNPDPQPIQRVGANLIRRSGLAPEFINQVLLELEYTMVPPPAAARPPVPVPWKPMLEAMRSELKPGFVREDGLTTSQPLVALSLVASDGTLAKRLRPLLRHPAFVPRIYVAMTLARLGASDALPDLLALIREGYPFSDSVALASGKHFDQSQTVRWRGFLCMALGRLGGAEARLALEQFAADPRQPRDIRFSSVVGLGFIGSTDSLPVLRQAATNDIIWMIREEARHAAAGIETLAQENRP
jgi:HEAT repeat protein